VEIGRPRTIDAAVGHQRNLVLNTLSDWQPVQRVTKYQSDVLVESGASDEALSGVQYRLQTLSSVRLSAIQDSVAIIHLAVNQRVDECATRRSDRRTERSCRIL